MAPLFSVSDVREENKYYRLFILQRSGEQTIRHDSSVGEGGGEFKEIQSKSKMFLAHPGMNSKVYTIWVSKIVCTLLL